MRDSCETYYHDTESKDCLTSCTFGNLFFTVGIRHRAGQILTIHLEVEVDLMSPLGVFRSPFHLPFRSVGLAAVKHANITMALKTNTKLLIPANSCRQGSPPIQVSVRPTVIEYIVSSSPTGCSSGAVADEPAMTAVDRLG